MPLCLYAENKISLGFKTDGYLFNNNDFIEYDHKLYVKNKAIPEKSSDDKICFITSSIEINYSYITPETFLNIGASKNAYWGNNNLSNSSKDANNIAINSLYYNYSPTSNFKISLGRQYFSLGNSINDYFFSDDIDCVLLNLNIPAANDIFSLYLITDLTGNSAYPNNANAWSGISKDDETIDDFNGDTLSLRYTYSMSFSFIKVYSSLIRYGASTKGSADISENGKNTLNETDNDHLFSGGTRLYKNFSKFGNGDFTFAYSSGKDYQIDAEKSYEGYATALNYSIPFGIEGFYVGYLKNYFLSFGHFSKGFCGMKGSTPGGILTSAYKGYALSPYAGNYHFKDFSKNKNTVTAIDITTPKSFFKTGFQIEIGKFKITISDLLLFANEDPKSTISSNSDKNISGKGNFQYMGNEFSCRLDYKYNEIIIYAEGATYKPSSYYKIRSKYNQFIFNGSDFFYGINFGSEFKLSY